MHAKNSKDFINKIRASFFQVSPDRWINLNCATSMCVHPNGLEKWSVVAQMNDDTLATLKKFDSKNEAIYYLDLLMQILEQESDEE